MYIYEYICIRIHAQRSCVLQATQKSMMRKGSAGKFSRVKCMYNVCISGGYTYILLSDSKMYVQNVFKMYVYE